MIDFNRYMKIDIDNVNTHRQMETRRVGKTNDTINIKPGDRMAWVDGCRHHICSFVDDVKSTHMRYEKHSFYFIEKLHHYFYNTILLLNRKKRTYKKGVDSLFLSSNDATILILIYFYFIYIVHINDSWTFDQIEWRIE